MVCIAQLQREFHALRPRIGRGDEDTSYFRIA